MAARLVFKKENGWVSKVLYCCLERNDILLELSVRKLYNLIL